MPINELKPPPLAASVITPQAALTRSRFMIAALSEISGEWNATEQQQEGEPDDGS